MSFDGGSVDVLAAVGSGCEPGEDVDTLFDGRTGEPGPAPASAPALKPRPATDVTVKNGVVRLRGHDWQAHVREVPRSWQTMNAQLAGGGLIFVAVTGKWGKQCSE